MELRELKRKNSLSVSMARLKLHLGDCNMSSAAAGSHGPVRPCSAAPVWGTEAAIFVSITEHMPSRRSGQMRTEKAPTDSNCWGINMARLEERRKG